MGKGRKRQIRIDPKIELLLKTHVSSINLVSKGMTFNSFKLAKIVIQELNMPKTKLRIYHQQVKVILKKWIKAGYCEEQKIEGEQSTKMICQFSEKGIQKIREESTLPLC
ncbi:MAG: hypothetical protein JRJ62_01605 [Deltaproteobacteria bacterium]|nr:hypothetical protein [Deltaproteobacteria bacterium]